MKKLAAVALLGIIAAPAYASDFSEISGSVGLGFQTSSIDPNYGECWQECFGSQEPTGFAFEGTVNFGPLFLSADLADLDQDEGAYDDDIETMWKDTSFALGYNLELSEGSALVLFVEQSDVEWEYKWNDADGVRFDEYQADDSGMSFGIGAAVDVTEKLTAGASISMGFAEGLDTYAQYKMTDSLAVKASISNKAYELENFERNDEGGPNGSPVDTGVDGDYQIDTQMMRVSFQYMF